MGVIRIETEGAVTENRCAACGGTNRLLHGYVYENEFAYGVYFVEWCDGAHPRRSAFLTVGLGPFGEESDPAERRSFGIEWHRDGMSLMDDPAVDRSDLLGPFVPWSEALRMTNIEDLWHIADHIATDDPRLAQVVTWIEGT